MNADNLRFPKVSINADVGHQPRHILPAIPSHDALHSRANILRTKDVKQPPVPNVLDWADTLGLYAGEKIRRFPSDDCH